MPQSVAPGCLEGGLAGNGKFQWGLWGKVASERQGGPVIGRVVSESMTVGRHSWGTLMGEREENRGLEL